MNAKTLFAEANNNKENGHTVQAIQLYSRIIDEFPNSPEAELSMAIRYKLWQENPSLKEDISSDVDANLTSENEDLLHNMPFISSDVFPEKVIVKTHGMARGSTVRAKHIGRDIMAEVKNLVGGELKGYTELLAEGREEAIYRMKQDAVTLGANAITCVRFTTSTISAGASEILAYGTAVTIEMDNDL